MSPPLQLQNMISLIMYCDYIALQADFTKSFRTLSFEAWQQTKARNRNYYHWSKLLRETVRNYGQTRRGPFYTGMSTVLDIPQFNIFLLSPTSTTTQLEVATKFSGEEGMILQFRNSSLVKGMECSWFSRYREEEEWYG